jgi:hypothetical protein
MVRIPPFQGGDTGSSPVGVTTLSGGGLRTAARSFPDRLAPRKTAGKMTRPSGEICNGQTMEKTQALPKWLAEDLTAWAAVDVPAYKQREKHPLLSHCTRLLSWLYLHHPFNEWSEIRPGHVQAFIQAHPDLKASTVHSYVKALRKWLRWHERDEVDKPILSARLKGICPKRDTDDPFVPDEATWNRLLQRTHWIFAGSSALKLTLGSRRRVAFMGDWRKQGFHLFCRLGAELGLRPWETAFLHAEEIHLNARPPHIRLQDRPTRGRKTALAGTPLRLPDSLASCLAAYMKDLPEHGYLFALPCEKTPCGFRAPHYDQIWAALREEFGLPLNARMLRRLFATRLAGKADLFDVIRATRHNNVETLLRHYLQRHGGSVVDPQTGKLWSHDNSDSFSKEM